jgi:serine/threonine protein kinase
MRPLLPGEPLTVGRYEIEATLGAGGMGTVYLGRSPGGRPAAVKVISPDYLEHPEAVARFRREVATVGTVRSAYTAALIDYELNSPPFWMATEYIPGPTLSSAVKADGPMPPGRCAEVMAAVAEGLGDIHRHGICHRDLKPQNVILSATGPQLIDFGLARSAGASGFTLTGVSMGTPGYIAPEMVDGDDLTPATDVFALGATMAYAATGRRPYGHGSFQAIYLRLMREQIDVDGVDPALASVIRACVVNDPASRPSPDEIIGMCRHLRSTDGTTPTRLLSHLPLRAPDGSADLPIRAHGSPARSTGEPSRFAGTARPGAFTGSARPTAGTARPETGSARPDAGSARPTARSARPGTGSARPETGSAWRDAGAARAGAGAGAGASGPDRRFAGAARPVTMPPGRGPARPGLLGNWPARPRQPLIILGLAAAGLLVLVCGGASVLQLFS